MKVYDLHDKEGRVFAFQIENVVIGRREVCYVASRIPGATLLRRPVRFLSWFRESTFCEFELEGVRFSADEGPWGDDSRYWVGPEPPRWVPQLQVVRSLITGLCSTDQGVFRWCALSSSESFSPLSGGSCGPHDERCQPISFERGTDVVPIFNRTGGDTLRCRC